MDYRRYGISRTLVERVKKKMKDPGIRERVKKILDGVTREDLQNPRKVRELLKKAAKAAGLRIDGRQETNLVRFVIDQKIDPRNTFHLIRLWNMFR